MVSSQARTAGLPTARRSRADDPRVVVRAARVSRAPSPRGRRRDRADNDVVATVQRRIGANIMACACSRKASAPGPRPRRSDAGVVLSHTARASWPRPGGTTFHFCTDGIERTLARAREAAGGKDVRICGGADTIRQYLDAGVVDELGSHSHRFCSATACACSMASIAIAFASSSSKRCATRPWRTCARRSQALARIEACRAVATSLRLPATSHRFGIAANCATIRCTQLAPSLNTTLRDAFDLRQRHVPVQVPITSTIGGIEIDLASAPLEPGEHRLEIESTIGGIEIYVPRYVQIHRRGRRRDRRL